MSKEQSSKPAIKVTSVSKDFVLPHEKQSSVKQSLINLKSGRTKEVQHALKDISFEVKKGEFFGIVGRNGSGKSTLLKILAGIYRSTEGAVTVNGSLVPFIELGVGFNPELSGRDNIFLNGALLGFSREEIGEMYDDIVGFAELERFMDQKLKNYSSGMQVRLAFSIAIKAQSDILLIDEVLAVGDADFQRKCFEYFRSLKKDKKTVVLVTHDMSAIREYCDRALLINDSVVEAVGSAEEIATKYNRLFESDHSEDKVVEISETRHGNKMLAFSKPNHVEALRQEDQSLVIKIVVTANKKVEDPNFGISIKDAGDNYICGTNTRLKNIHFGTLEKGRIINLEWELPNIFHDGKHYINIAAVDLSESVQYDWWDEASSFIVYKDEKTPFIVTPNIILETKQS